MIAKEQKMNCTFLFIVPIMKYMSNNICTRSLFRWWYPTFCWRCLHEVSGDEGNTFPHPRRFRSPDLYAAIPYKKFMREKKVLEGETPSLHVPRSSQYRRSWNLSLYSVELRVLRFRMIQFRPRCQLSDISNHARGNLHFHVNFYTVERSRPWLTLSNSTIGHFMQLYHRSASPLPPPFVPKWRHPFE